MENTTEVPNDLIISAHKEACDKWKGIIEKACPLLFPKDKFEKGKWYIHNDKDAIFCSNGNQIKSVGFGVDGSGKWTEDFWMYDYQVKDYRLATPSEVESHLIKVAEGKGFKVGVSFYNIHVNGGSATIKSTRKIYKYDFFYDEELDTLKMDGWIIYAQGKWATIIPSPLEVTLDEVAKKFGVSEVKIKQQLTTGSKGNSTPFPSL